MRRRIILLLIPLLSGVAILRLGFEFHRLILDPGPQGAVDLRLIYQMVHASFSGEPLQVAYPPASSVILWPFAGWVSFSAARWLFAGTLIVAIACMVMAVMRACQPADRLERMLAGLFVLAIYPTAIVVGNGQLAIHLVAALLGAIFLLLQRKSWKTDVAVVVLLLFAMVKPNFSIPFFLVVCFVCGAWRKVLAVAILYIGITFAIISFHNRDLLEALWSWSNRALVIDDGYGHIHLLLFRLGIPEWSPVCSLILLGLLAIWLHRHRFADLWILLGVTAIIARVWTYHRLFDDLLLLLPAVALVRIVKARRDADGKVVTLFVLVLLCISLLQPGTLLTHSTLWGSLFRSLQILLWITVLIFLGINASRQIRILVTELPDSIKSPAATKI